MVLEDVPAALTAGRAAGTTTVALTTTHAPSELVADIAVPDLSAASAQATAHVVEIVATASRPNSGPSNSAIRTAVIRSGGGLFYLPHDHDEQPHPCDRGDHDARCSLYVSNVRLLRAPA